MNEKTTSDIIATVLNETYTYLRPKHDSDELEIIKANLLLLTGVNSFKFTPVKGKHYSYENIQDILSTLNEKESFRKSKGVYYTPADVVKFIIDNSIKAVYGKLGTNGLHVMDLNGVPYQSFCMTKAVLEQIIT